MTNTRKVEAILPSPPKHWVGDGFPVTTVISPHTVRNRLSPFVLFDYAGPDAFEPSDQPRGVDSHPHRGFETVTVVYQGELEHRDSAGHRGSIGPGDVQWMTAASGVLHEEKHSREFTRRGGTLEMAQLWVNLPAKHKMSPPRYQELLREQIPVVTLPDQAGSIRVIAGNFHDTVAAAQTFTPVILWDVKLRSGAELTLPVASGFSLGIFARSGSIQVGDSDTVNSRQLVVCDRSGTHAVVRAEQDAEFLVVGGEPINEPVVAYGPFVMNTPQEIELAIRDVQSGKLGQL